MANAYTAYDIVRMYELSYWAPDERQARLFDVIQHLPACLTRQEIVYDPTAWSEDDDDDPDDSVTPPPPPDWRPWNNS